MSAAPVQLFLDNTFGALLIGVFIAAALWGITCTQTFIYFNNYPNDTIGMKVLVFCVWLLDTTHQALICHTAYTYLVTHFAQVEFLGAMVNTLVIEVFFNGMVALLVQSFFARRVWILSKHSVVLTGAVMLFVVAEFVAVFYYAARGSSFTTLGQLSELKALSITVNALAAAGDLLIAVILCWILQTSRTGFSKSDTVITKLIAISINTGLVTSICAILSLITIVVFPNAFIYITFYFTLGRLYSNSLLATLNARKALRDATQDMSMSTRSGNNHRTGMGGLSMGGTMRNPKTKMNIQVSTTRTVDYDPHSSEVGPFDDSPYANSKGDSFLPSSDSSLTAV